MSYGAVLDLIATYSGLLPVIAFLYNYRHLDSLMKLISAFLIVSALFDILLSLSSDWGVANNMPAIHVYIIINIVFFGFIYYKAFFDERLKKITLVLTGVALLVCLYFAQRLLEYPSISNTASGIAFIILALLYFYQLLTRQEFVHIEKQGLFWFNAAVLFYFSINIFLFMLFPLLPLADRPSYYIINNITNIIANLLYTTALLCQPQKTA
ncbi:MAG: hypothetical protein JST32_01160 [Bacteroidetes bacterium]|nr:hypothetical protein [Bacteroidota bacterium]